MPMYVRCAAFVSLGGFIYGFDTGSIGPVTLMPYFQDLFGPLSPTLHGLVISIILIPACISSLVAGPIADRISRTYAISLGAGCYAIGSLLQCLSGFGGGRSEGLAMLFIGRIFAGMGEGIFLSPITVYAVEVTPGKARGRVASLVQLGICLGICAGYFICYGSLRIDSSLSWRLPFACQTLIASGICVGCLFLPHSPRWLFHVGRKEEALAALEVLEITQNSTDIEKEEILTLIRDEDYSDSRGWFRKLVDDTKLMFEKETRGRTSLGVFMSGMQQLTGIDGLLYYAPVLFTQAGLSSTNASFLASGVSGLVNVVITIIAQFFTDKWGRRPTMIFGNGFCAATMIAIGGIYASGANSTEHGRYAVIALIYLFLIGFCSTTAIMCRIYVTEIQPIKTRAAASSLSLSANWSVNWIVAFTTPMFLARSSSGPYFLWGGSTFFAVLIFIFFMPETKGRSLESVDQAFETSPLQDMIRKLSGKRNSANLETHQSVERVDVHIEGEK